MRKERKMEEKELKRGETFVGTFQKNKSFGLDL